MNMLKNIIDFYIWNFHFTLLGKANLNEFFSKLFHLVHGKMKTDLLRSYHWKRFEIEVYIQQT